MESEKKPFILQIDMTKNEKLENHINYEFQLYQILSLTFFAFGIYLFLEI